MDALQVTSLILSIAGTIASVGITIVIGVIGFFIKRLIAQLDSKPSREDLNVITRDLDRNYKEDTKREEKLDKLIEAVNNLVLHMQQLENKHFPCQSHKEQLNNLDTRISNVEKPKRVYRQK